MSKRMPFSCSSDDCVRLSVPMRFFPVSVLLLYGC
jgi:hypothetical protein